MSTVNAVAPALLKVRQAAAFLNISPALLRKLVQDGQIPAIILPAGKYRTWLIDRADLQDWVSKSKMTF
jgi:excisionase family DNA binding protein